MDKELERAYDALMQADAAGNKEDAQQIADYIRTLEAQQNVPSGETSVKQVSDADLINVLTPTIGGAIAGEIVGPIVNKGVEAVQSGKAPTTTAPAARAAGTPFNPRGVTIEQSVQNWENYGQAQNEAAKRVRREAELHKKYPGFTRAQPPTPAATPSAMSQLRQAIPGPVKTAGQFLGGATQSGVVPWLGRALAGGAAGYQGADAYNRLRQGDVVGGGLSAIGTLGAGASFFPHPAARYGGAAISAGAEGLNQYLDYLKRKSQQPAAAQPQQQEQMPVPMKEGGLVHLAGGKVAKAAHEYGGQATKKLSDWAQNYIDQYLVPTQADRMGMVGGPSYSANQLALPQYKGRAWGSGNQSTASMISNLARDPRFGGAENQIFTPILGKDTMHQSNKIVFDRMMEEFYKDPSKLTPELRAKINDYIQSGGAIRGKAQGFEPIPKFDIADKEQVKELANTFQNRGLIATHGFGGVDIGGRKAQIIPYNQILADTMDPTVAGAKTFSVGPRAFSLTGDVENVPRPDLNAAYPYQLLGKDLGVTYTPTPSELALMDFQRQWRKDTGRTAPLKSGALPQPGYFEHTLGYKPEGASQRVYPRQKMTEEWIKELQRSGHAEGGSTTPAWQRKEGKSPSGGLNALGRASYKRETGGELKAPQPEGGSRKKSFCARMGGMKKKLTSSETANDPDSRINKALRKWKC